MLAAAHCAVKRHRPRAASSDYATAWPPWKPTESTPRLRLQLLPEPRDLRRAHREDEGDGAGPTSRPHKLCREHRGLLGRPWLAVPAACGVPPAVAGRHGSTGGPSHLLARQSLESIRLQALEQKMATHTQHEFAHGHRPACQRKFRIKFRLWSLEPPSPVIERRLRSIHRPDQESLVVLMDIATTYLWLVACASGRLYPE